MISKYILTKEERFQKCYNDGYLESCKIAKEIDDSGTGRNTCDNLEWDANTRVNVGHYCRNKLNNTSWLPTKNLISK